MSIIGHEKAEFDLNRYGSAVPTHVARAGSPYWRTNGELWVNKDGTATGWYCPIRIHSATPEAAITAPIGTLCVNTAGGASTTLYVKTSGTGNTGWTAK